MSVRTVRSFLCLFSCFTTTAYSQDHVRPVSYPFPEILSHQGALSRRSRKMQNAEVSAVRTPPTPWHRQLTPREILERQGSAFRLDILKTNAVALRYKKGANERRMDALRTPW